MRKRYFTSVGFFIIIAIIVAIVFFGCYLLFNSSDNDAPEYDTEPVGPLTGIYEGSYAWTSGSGGSAAIVVELTQRGSLLNGTAAYLGSKTSLAGTVIEDSITMMICGNDAIFFNVFNGSISGARISGTTLNGEGSSEPIGPSGTFDLDRKAVSGGSPYRIRIYGPGAILSGNKSQAYIFTVEAQDSADFPTPVENDAVIALESGGKGSFYGDKQFSIPITSIRIPSGGMSRCFYYMDSVSGNRVITAADENGNLVEGQHSVSVIAPGGSISCSLNGSQIQFSRDASVTLTEGSGWKMICLLGYDDARNLLNAFFREDSPGSYSCVNVYYQTKEGAQWGAGGSIGGTCEGNVSQCGLPGELVIGAFSANLVAQFGGATGEKTIDNGTFSVIRLP